MKLSSARRCGETCSGRVPVSRGLRHRLPHPLRRPAGRLHRPGRAQSSEPERRAHVAQVAGCFQVRHRRACPRRPAPPINRSPPAQLPACPPAPRPALTCSPSSGRRLRRGLARGSRSSARSAGAAPSSSRSPPPAPPRSSSPAEHIPPPTPPARPPARTVAACHTGTPLLESPAQT